MPVVLTSYVGFARLAAGPPPAVFFKGLDMANKVILEYRCQRCGTLYDLGNPVGKHIADQMLGGVKNNDYNSGVEFHQCGNGLGIATIAGYRELKYTA